MNGITLESVVNFILRYGIQIVLLLSLFIQIAPVKINPLSSFVKWIIKQVTSETAADIKEIKAELKSMRADIDENEKDRIRWEILDFANSCRNMREHSRDEFQHIIALNDKYRALLEKTDDANGVFETEYDYILDLYHDLLRTNGFLK